MDSDFNEETRYYFSRTLVMGVEAEQRSMSFFIIQWSHLFQGTTEGGTSETEIVENLTFETLWAVVLNDFLKLMNASVLRTGLIFTQVLSQS